MQEKLEKQGPYKNAQLCTTSTLQRVEDVIELGICGEIIDYAY